MQSERESEETGQHSNDGLGTTTVETVQTFTKEKNEEVRIRMATRSRT